MSDWKERDISILITIEDIIEKIAIENNKHLFNSWSMRALFFVIGFTVGILLGVIL